MGASASSELFQEWHKNPRKCGTVLDARAAIRAIDLVREAMGGTAEQRAAKNTRFDEMVKASPAFAREWQLSQGVPFGHITQVVFIDEIPDEPEEPAGAECVDASATERALDLDPSATPVAVKAAKPSRTSFDGLFGSSSAGKGKCFRMEVVGWSISQLHIEGGPEQSEWLIEGNTCTRVKCADTLFATWAAANPEAAKTITDVPACIAAIDRLHNEYRGDNSFDRRSEFLARHGNSRAADLGLKKIEEIIQLHAPGTGADMSLGHYHMRALGRHNFFVESFGRYGACPWS
jgi:hypothetical protein